jgi:hypothetical protein
MSAITRRHPRRNTRFYKQPIVFRRIRTRRLTVGRWPYQREVLVAEIKALVLGEGVR